MAEIYGPPAPSGPIQPQKPFAQRLEESYFAGQKPSQEELLGFRQVLSMLQSTQQTPAEIEANFAKLKNANFEFSGMLGDDYYQNKLTQQIANQRKNLGTEKYYGGDLGAIGGIDSATSYMASRLVRSGIRDLSEIGERPIQEDGVITGKQIYNKRTGEPLKQGDDAQYYYAVNTIAPDANQYIFGGTFAGKNTSLNISMVDGMPVFYTTPGPSSSDFDIKDIAPMVAVASLMMPGVGQAIGSFVVEAALGTAAAQGMSAVALGAIGSGVLTTVLTGDVKQGVLASAGTYLGAQMGDIIGETAKGIFDSPAGQKFAQSMGTAMTRAAVLGQDVSEAAMGAAAGEALNLVTGSIPGFSDIKDPKTKLAITEAIQAGLSQPGSLSDRISAAALQGAVTLGASQINVDGKKFVDLDPGQKTLVTSALSAALSGKPLDQALIQSAISNVQSEFARTLKQPTAAQPEDFGYQPGVEDQPMIDDLGFKPSPDVSPVTPFTPVSTEAVSPPTVVLPTGVTGAEIPFRRETFFGDFPQLAFDPETGLIIPPRPIQAGERAEGQPDVFGPQLPRTFPTLDPSAGVVTDVGPPITREELISDPNQPSRQIVPGSASGEVPIQKETLISDPNQPSRQPAPGTIPGEVPMIRETFPEADKQAKTREEISDEVYKQLVENFENASPSTLRAAADLALDYSSFDPNIPTPMSDAAEQNKSLIAQGVADAYKQLTVATPILLKLQTDALQVDKAQKWLSRYDLVDEGRLNEAFAQINKGDQYDQRILSEYSRATPEQRAEIRDRQNGVIKNSTGAAIEAIKLYEQFKKDRQDQNIRVPEFTDIRTDNIKDLAEDFSKWLQYNVGAGSVSTATVMLGALIGGPVGALAVSTPMATGEALANRMKYLSEVYKGKSPDETASSVLEYLNKTGESNLVIGAISGALDLMGPVGTALRRQATNTLAKEVIERPVVGALKNVSKEMIEEAFTGGMQELTQILGERYLGEQEGTFLTVANAKRLINSAAAEAAGSLGGSGINIATASGAEQWKNKTIEIAKEHAREEVAARQVLYPDLQNPQTPEQAVQYRQALDRLSDPTTSRSVTEFDLYGSGFSEVPINKPEFGVKSSTQTLEGSTVYNLGDGYAALEDAFGGIKVINEAGRVVPLTANEVTDLYDTVIEPYKKQQLTKEVAKPVDQTVDTTGTVVDTGGVRLTVPVDTSGTSQPTGTTPVIVTPPTGSTQPVVTDTSRPTDTTGGGTKLVVTEPTVVDTTVNKPAGTSTSSVTGDATGTSTTVVTRPEVTDTSGLSSGATVTNPDAIAALNMVLGKAPVDLRFDIDKDGVVSASDVLSISRGATVPQSLPADATKVGTGVVADSGATGTPTNVVSGTGSSTVVDTGAGTATGVVPGAGTGTPTGSITNTSGAGTGAGTVVDTGKATVVDTGKTTDTTDTGKGTGTVVDTGKATDTGKTVVSTGTTNVSDGTGGATVIGDKTVTDTKPVVDTGKTVVTDTGGTSPVTTDTTGGATVTTPAPLTEEQIRKIVNDALVANPSLSESDVKRIVGDAVSKIPGSITAADVKFVVDDAISKLPKTPTVADITGAVNLATTGFAKQSDIDLAISNIKFPSSLSREDVQGIVRTVMQENPGLSITDVQGAINTAIANLPAAASPSDVNRAIYNTVGNPSVIDDPNTPEDESKPATGIYAVIESSQEKSKQQISDLKKDLEKLTTEQETQRKAAKAAEEQSRQRSLLNLGTSMLGGAAGAGILGGLGALGAAPTALPPLKGLTTGEATKDEFVSPLAAFQKQIGLTPQQETKPEEQDRTMPYFSYGQPSEVASVLNLQDEEEQLVAKGGLITPLMASGGLPVVHYAGKPRIDFRKGAYVQGPGDGQSDDIPAMLADGEYVFDAETVAALGNGSNKAGAKLLDKMREQIRAHKRGGSLKKIPPASKSPLEYLAMAKR
jgi:hypothetical protein